MSISESDLSSILSKGHCKVAGNKVDPLTAVIRKHGFEGAVPVKKPSKYRNQRVTTEDGVFDSKWELARFQQLKMMERGGLISGLQRQVSFELIPSATLDSRKLPPVTYRADFVYHRDGEQVVEDAKGGESTAEFKLKRRLMWWVHKIKVTEVRR